MDTAILAMFTPTGIHKQKGVMAMTSKMARKIETGGMGAAVMKIRHGVIGTINV